MRADVGWQFRLKTEAPTTSGDAYQEIAVVGYPRENRARPTSLEQHEPKTGAGRQFNAETSSLGSFALKNTATEQQVFAAQNNILHGDFSPVKGLESGFIRCHAAQRGKVSFGRASRQLLPIGCRLNAMWRKKPQ